MCYPFTPSTARKYIVTTYHSFVKWRKYYTSRIYKRNLAENNRIELSPITKWDGIQSHLTPSVPNLHYSYKSIKFLPYLSLTYLSIGCKSSSYNTSMSGLASIFANHWEVLYPFISITVPDTTKSGI